LWTKIEISSFLCVEIMGFFEFLPDVSQCH
jgi:hypothetical protein